jgi:hypothetical protein
MWPLCNAKPGIVPLSAFKRPLFSVTTAYCGPLRTPRQLIGEDSMIGIFHQAVTNEGGAHLVEEKSLCDGMQERTPFAKQ